MTIDEAITLLSGLRTFLPEVGLNKYMASLQVGIEALKRVKELRLSGKPDRWNILKGETEE